MGTLLAAGFRLISRLKAGEQLVICTAGGGGYGKSPDMPEEEEWFQIMPAAMLNGGSYTMGTSRANGSLALYEEIQNTG